MNSELIVEIFCIIFAAIILLVFGCGALLVLKSTFEEFFSSSKFDVKSLSRATWSFYDNYIKTLTDNRSKTEDTKEVEVIYAPTEGN